MACGPQAEALCARLAQFDYLYLSGISLAILAPADRTKLLALLRRCRANGGQVIFDNNYRPRLWQSREETQLAYREVLTCTDIAFLTLDDEALLWARSRLNRWWHARRRSASARSLSNAARMPVCVQRGESDLRYRRSRCRRSA